MGSGEEMLKNGPATGFRLPIVCASLSHQPAYQTRRSIAASTSREAAFALRPSTASLAAKLSRRSSIISATR